MRQLNKKQALELLPLVVDDEANEDDKRAFFQYIEQDEEMRRRFESMKRMKEIIRYRTPRLKAPAHLKVKISSLIEEEDYKSPFRHQPRKETVQDKTEHVRRTPDIIHPANEPGKVYKLSRVAISIAAILFLSFLTILVLDKTAPVFETEFSLEKYAFLHYTQKDNLSVASQQTASLVEARDFLSTQLNHYLRMPRIKDASITSVTNIDFVPKYKTPMLTYTQVDNGGVIYIFAFNIDRLEEFKRIVRDPEAVNVCKTVRDYHIRDVQGKHVVSWKWGNYWYTAISEQDGHEFAQLVPPLGDR